MVNDKPLTVFAQGMRRSGTTIWFDLMLEDGTFECFYEPLAAGKPILGGGSSAHADQDLFMNVRSARERFLNKNPGWLEHFPAFKADNLLNYGAPRRPELEFETDLPAYCRDYIQFLASSAPRTFLKFTRVHSKVAALKELAPNAKFLHLIRDPRHVTASYLFGKNARNRKHFPDADTFFTRVSNYSAWSSRPFSDFLLNLLEYRHLSDCPDFMRILLIWKYSFEHTHAMGKKHFGKNYLLLRHEDLLVKPRMTLDKLGTFLGSPLRSMVMDWAVKNLHAPYDPYSHLDSRWGSAFERLAMSDTLLDAGYQ